jgi:RNA polymerase sigma-70 factor (sigma-E family)
MPSLHGSFDAFVAANLDGLARAAYLITWDEHDADDLVQECLIKVARHWNRVRVMQQPLAYARRVLINLALDNAKHRARRRAELDQPDTAVDQRSREAGIEPAELRLLGTRDELVAGLAQLAPRQRAVLVLRYFLDLSEADTARALGCSVGTVKNTASKALARLRQRLEPDKPLAEVHER